MTYFNEHDAFAAAWLRNLFPEATVDPRSIADVAPDDLTGFRRVHLFGGIGGWELALRLAGWPDDRPVWTGSCPCQPFSQAGRGGGASDPRNLWPEMRRLVAVRRPAALLGEQVASPAGRRWLAGARADLEDLGYACGATDLCAAGVGAPHLRQRLYWGARLLADVQSGGCDQQRGEGRGATCPRSAGDVRQPAHGGGTDRMADADSPSRRQDPGGRSAQFDRTDERRPETTGQPRIYRVSCSLADADGSQRGSDGPGNQDGAGPGGRGPVGTPGGGRTPDIWGHFDLVACRDGRARRVEPGTLPLAHGLSALVGRGESGLGRLDLRAAGRNRTGRLRGYGNAVVPQLAAVFVRAFLDSIPDAIAFSEQFQ